MRHRPYALVPSRQARATCWTTTPAPGFVRGLELPIGAHHHHVGPVPSIESPRCGFCGTARSCSLGPRRILLTWACWGDCSTSFSGPRRPSWSAAPSCRRWQAAATPPPTPTPPGAPGSGRRSRPSCERTRAGGRAAPGRRPRCVRRPGHAGACRRAHARHPVLHLARRPLGLAAVRRGAARPTAACGFACCWTTTTPWAWTNACAHWTRIRRSRCGCSIPLHTAVRACWTTSAISRG